MKNTTEKLKRTFAIMLMAIIVSITVFSTSGTETQAATTLSKTTNISISVKSTTSAKITWSKVSGAGGYQIYRKTGSGSWKKVKTITSGSTVSYTNTGLKAGKTYTYKVRAYKKKSGTYTYGSFSSTVKVTGGTPAKVTGLFASASAGGKIKLTWTKVSGADGYQIYRKTSGGSWKKVKTITSGSTVSYTNTGTPGKTYYYKVRAYNKSGGTTYTGSFSSSVSKKAIAVKQVTGLSASASAGGKIKLTWTKVSGADGYQIYRKTSGGSWKKVKTITSGSTVSYTNTGTPGKTYYYKVRAYNKSGGTTYTGSFSSSVSKKAIAVKKVTGLSTSASAGGTIKLTWTKVSGANGYQIYRKTSGGSWKKVKTITSGSTTSYTNTGLLSGTKYTYKVRAYKTINGTKYYGDYSDTSSSETNTDVKFKAISKATGDSVTGVEFRLYGTSDDGDVINMYAGAGEDETGWVIFESVPLGTYTLVESDSGGYVADTTEYTVTVRSKYDTSVTPGTDADMYCITITTKTSGGSTMKLIYDSEAGGYIYYAYYISTEGFYIKIVTPQGQKISGVTFRLTGTSDYGTYYSDTTTSDSNRVSFTDLEPGTYYLTEISVANASPAVIDTNSDTIWTVKVTVDGKIYIDDVELTSDNFYTYTIINIPYYGFGIYKTTETGEKAYGVTFQLSGLSDYNHYYNESVTTSASGYAYFEDIEPGTYTLIETEISDNAYPTNLTLLEDTVWIVVITDEGKITITEYSDDETTVLTSSSSTWKTGGSWQNLFSYYLLGIVTIVNPVGVNLEFYKIISVNNEPISGVVFRLYDAGTGGQKYDQKATSSSEGKVKFTGLTTTIGTYYLVEVNVENSSPKAMLDSTVYTVTVKLDEETGEVTVTVTGAETATRDTTTGDITLDDNGDVIVIPNEIYYYLTVIKRDKYTALTIEGVTFRVWNSSGTYDEEVTTGEDGIALFDELESGYYFLQETAVPTTTTTTTDEDGNTVTTTTDNYWLDETEHLVYVDADEGVVYVDGEALNKSYEYTMYNKPKTSS